MSDKPSFRRMLRGFIQHKVPLMMTCREFEGVIINYLEGELPRFQRRIFELHIRTCRECRDYLDAYKKTMALGKAVFTEPGAPPPSDVPEELVKAVLAARNQAPSDS